MIKRSIALALLIALPGLAQATAVNLGGSEKNLQTILDELTTSGTSSVDVLNDQYGPDELWKVTATGNATATLIVEIAGNAPYNQFGIYDPTNPSSRVALFSGAAGAGAPATMTLFADGSVFVNAMDSGVDLAGNHFGFYLATIKDNVVRALWHSERGRNADGADHMVAYRGTGDEVQLPNRFQRLRGDGGISHRRARARRPGAAGPGPRRHGAAPAQARLSSTPIEGEGDGVPDNSGTPFSFAHTAHLSRTPLASRARR